MNRRTLIHSLLGLPVLALPGTAHAETQIETSAPTRSVLLKISIPFDVADYNLIWPYRRYREIPKTLPAVGDLMNLKMSKSLRDTLKDKIPDIHHDMAVQIVTKSGHEWGQDYIKNQDPMKIRRNDGCYAPFAVDPVRVLRGDWVVLGRAVRERERADMRVQFKTIIERKEDDFLQQINAIQPRIDRNDIDHLVVSLRHFV